MADVTLLEYFRELMESYDDDIGTSAGESFRTRVMDPFLQRVGDSPLDGDLETFLADRVSEEMPDLDTGPNSGIRDLVIRPMATMLAPIRREINAIKISQSLNDYELMTRTELNSLLGNFFLSIQDGSVATGTVRVYYSTPQSAVVTSITQFSDSTGNYAFSPTEAVSISSTEMAFNAEGSYYYVDVAVQAVAAGETYNLSAGDISTVTGLTGMVSVTNKQAFTSATDDETKTEAVDRAKDSITIRNLSTTRGIQTLISSEHPSIEVIEVVGFGDTEMVRDVVTGPVTVSGVPGGFTGTKSLILSSSDSIHIGGKTDVYAYQESPVDAAVDVTNITDVGKRVARGFSGYTAASPSSSLHDNRGYFESYEIVPGDYLVLGRITAVVASVVSQTEITISPYADPDDSTVTVSTLPAGLFDQFYEIIRKEDIYIRVPFYDLVALDSDGNAVVNSATGNYVQPVPGDLALSALTDDSDDYVDKEDNVSSVNISLPMVRVASVGELDPTQLVPTGKVIPLADILLCKVVDDFTGISIATGDVRAYFKDEISSAMTSGTYGTYPVFTYGVNTYSPEPLIEGGTASGKGRLTIVSASSACTLYVNGGYTPGTVSAGDFIVLHATAPAGGSGTATVADASYLAHHTLHMVESVTVLDSDNATITVRHDGAASYYPFGGEGGTGGLNSGTVFSFEIVKGTDYTAIAQDSDSGLYYADYTVVQNDGGAINKLSKDTEVSVDDFLAEGYRLRSDEIGVAFSTREKPYVQFTNYVSTSDGHKNLLKTSTAYAMRFSYEYADTLDAVQDFVDDPDNRIVAEDILVKHFLPGMVMGTLSAEDVTDAAGLLAIQEVVTEVSPTVDLEISDLVGALYTAGATHVTMPVTLVVLHHGQTREVTASIVTDAQSASRTQKFISSSDLAYSELE